MTSFSRNAEPRSKNDRAKDAPLCPDNRIPHLDGWRGLAILLVLYAHFGGDVRFGVLGVQFFFVLSGLLTAKVLFLDRMPLGKFYQHRIARIIPALYVYLLIVYAWAYLGFEVGESPLEMLSTATFVRTYWPPEADGWMNSLPLAHLWSLNVEEHAYVALSLIAWVAKDQSKLVVRVCLALALASATAFAWHRIHFQPGPGAFFPIRTECAALAILLSAGLFIRASTQGHELRQMHKWTSAAALICVTACVAIFPEKLDLQFVLVPALLAVAINGLSSGTELLRQPLEASWLRWVGQRSYSIYLWQQPAHFLWFHGHLKVSAWVALTGAIAMGLLSYVAVERPARRWINNLPSQSGCRA